MKKIILLTRLFAFGFTLLFMLNVNAQHTVIPANDVAAIITTPNKGAAIYFELNTLPANARIDSSKLELVLNQSVKGASGLLATYMGTKPPQVRSNQINAQTIAKGTVQNTMLQMKVDKNFIEASRASRIGIQLTGQLANSEAHFYGSADVNSAPRLIVYFSLDNRNPDWAGSHADAQHSNRTTNRYAGAAITGFGLKKLNVYSKIVSDLVAYNGIVYLQDNSSGSTLMLSVDAVTGNQTVVGTFEVATKMPAINPFGRLYYVSANKVEAVNLNNYSERSTAVNLGSNEIVAAAPTIGKDGTLYLAFNNFVRAYTPYPNHKLIWQSNFDGNKSPVTLSPNEGLAYVVNGDGKLICINTDNGSAIASKQLVMKDPDPNEGITIPLVTSTGSVYVANKLMQAGKLYIFGEALSTEQSVDGANISQPVSGADTVIASGNIQALASVVYYVNGGNLIKSKSNRKLVAPAVTVTHLDDSFPVRSLVADLSDNIYCLGENKVLYSYIKNNLLKTPAGVDGAALQHALIITRDGSICSNTSTSLYAFTPNYNGDYTLTDNDKQLNNYTFRANTLTVPTGYQLMGNKILSGVNAVSFNDKTSLTAGSYITVQSGGPVNFQNGFSVPSNSTFIVKKIQ